MTTKKTLDLTVTLGSGTFGEDVGDTVTLSGFRMTADVSEVGGDAMGRCQIRLYGLRNDLMNKLTTIGQINVAIRAKNAIILAAGDEGGTMSTVFQGTIIDAWADYNTSPDVAFNIVAFAGMDAAVKPVDATSYKGPTDVATVIGSIAQSEMGLVFEDNSVDVQVSSPYLYGTALEKVRNLARTAGISWSISHGVLAIWTRAIGRQGTTPTVSPDTGMVGYPSLSSKGMTVTMLYNPNVRLGGDIEVQSAIPMACGVWRVFGFSHSLSCELPDGPWFTTVEATHVE